MANKKEALNYAEISLNDISEILLKQYQQKNRETLKQYENNKSVVREEMKDKLEGIIETLSHSQTKNQSGKKNINKHPAKLKKNKSSGEMKR